ITELASTIAPPLPAGGGPSPREPRMHASFRAVAAVACLAVLLAGCGGTSESDGAADTPASTLAVTLVRAQAQPIQRTVVVSGPVAAVEEMQLGVDRK